MVVPREGMVGEALAAEATPRRPGRLRKGFGLRLLASERF